MKCALFLLIFFVKASRSRVQSRKVSLGRKGGWYKRAFPSGTTRWLPALERRGVCLLCMAQIAVSSRLPPCQSLAGRHSHRHRREPSGNQGGRVLSAVLFHPLPYSPLALMAKGKMRPLPPSQVHPPPPTLSPSSRSRSPTFLRKHASGVTGPAGSRLVCHAPFARNIRL